MLIQLPLLMRPNGSRDTLRRGSRLSFLLAGLSLTHSRFLHTHGRLDFVSNLTEWKVATKLAVDVVRFLDCFQVPLAGQWSTLKGSCLAGWIQTLPWRRRSIFLTASYPGASRKRAVRPFDGRAPRPPFVGRLKCRRRHLRPIAYLRRR